MQKKKVIIQDPVKIIEYLEGKSDSIINMMKHDMMKNEDNISYTLFQKYLSHSDLIAAGKRLGKDQTVDKNYLYYLSNSEMEELSRHQTMESAKQSNIGMPSEFYDYIEAPKLQRRQGIQTTEHEHPSLNKYADVYLVNDTLKYFNIQYTKKVFDNLGKNVNWNYEKYEINLNNSSFTPIELSYAIHGLGIEEDLEFHKLRRSFFKGDSFMCLVRKDLTNKKQEIYILLEKNPIFFTIVGEGNKNWEKYLTLKNAKDLHKLIQEDNLSKEESEKNRNLQGKWKDMLAAEMMNYTSVENQVFCPFTYITADYQNLKTLYRASHIKEFSKCTSEESYDINNGLLLCANADALFDKHLITIDENKNIIFSFILKQDMKLLQMLHLNGGVFDVILNDKRMKYLEEHRKIFEDKEALRRLGQLDDELEEIIVA